VTELRTSNDELKTRIRRRDEENRRQRVALEAMKNCSTSSVASSSSATAVGPSSAVGALQPVSSVAGAGICGDLIIAQQRSEIAWLKSQRAPGASDTRVAQLDARIVHLEGESCELQITLEDLNRKYRTAQENLNLMAAKMDRYREHVNTCPALAVAVEPLGGGGGGGGGGGKANKENSEAAVALEDVKDREFLIKDAQHVDSGGCAHQ